MSNTLINVKIGMEDDNVAVDDRLTRSNNPALEVAHIIENIASGIEKGKVLLHVEHTETAAAQTITFDSSEGTDGDTLTICGIVFTVRSAPSLQPQKGEYLLYADSDTAQAVAFVAAWNAHPTARYLASAANAAAVVTLTTREGGTLMNQGTLVTSVAGFAALGAATFAAGAAGTTVYELVPDPEACSIL